MVQPVQPNYFLTHFVVEFVLKKKLKFFRTHGNISIEGKSSKLMAKRQQKFVKRTSRNSFVACNSVEKKKQPSLHLF